MLVAEPVMTGTPAWATAIATASESNGENRWLSPPRGPGESVGCRRARLADGGSDLVAGAGGFQGNTVEALEDAEAAGVEGTGDVGGADGRVAAGDKGDSKRRQGWLPRCAGAR